MGNLLKYDKFEQFDRLIHGTTLKNDIFPYMFSFAFHTGEDVGDISKNRNHLMEKLGIDKDFDVVLANQTHSNNVVVIKERKTLGWKNHGDAISDCDALVTNQKNILIGVLTADCVPVLLFDKTKEVIAVVHAGWKGTKAQIVLKTIEKMIDAFDSNTKDIYAIIAPCIGSCCYEVSSDVADNFNDSVKQNMQNGKFMLDLKKENYNQLINAGLEKENIEVSNKCTSCDSDSFFSYRKEQECSGRFLSFIGMRG